MPWPTKPVTPGRVADHVPGVVVEVAAHEQIAREHLLLDDDLLAVLELDDVFHGDDDLVDAALHVHGRGAGLEVLLDLLLVARLRVHHEPLAGPVGRAVARRSLARSVPRHRPQDSLAAASRISPVSGSTTDRRRGASAVRDGAASAASGLLGASRRGRRPSAASGVGGVVEAHVRGTVVGERRGDWAGSLVDDPEHGLGEDVVEAGDQGGHHDEEDRTPSTRG